jgi:pectinesterase
MPGKGLDTTTGGGNATPVVVTSPGQLEDLVGGSTPRVIHVQGSLQFSRKMIDVGSNKTIIGQGSDAEIVGAGFFLDGVSNVIIRYITFRDTHMCGDWGGKNNGTDAFRSDGSHHFWIDHCQFIRGQDGLMDLRRTSSYLTVSWNIFCDHNKVGGFGWTDAGVATLHHNWFRNNYQRSPAIDNTDKCHLYNNFFENIMLYGAMNRGDTKLVAENNYFLYVNDPLAMLDSGDTTERGNIFDNTTGQIIEQGTTFEPSDDYSYTLDRVEDIPAIVRQYAGPGGGWPQAPSTITVDINGNGDYCLLFHALGVIPPDQQEHVTIIVKSGTYREVARLWPGIDNVTIRGATGDPSDVVITFEEGTNDEKFYGGEHGIDAGPTFAVYSNNVTLEDMTFENTGSGPVALRTLGENIVLNNVTINGEHITY